jgi:hypothetical protein
MGSTTLVVAVVDLGMKAEEVTVVLVAVAAETRPTAAVDLQ